MTKITKEDYAKAFEQLSKMPIEKQGCKLIYSKQYWLKVKPLNIEWNEEQLDNAIDGYIGVKKGIKCYITPLF